MRFRVGMGETPLGVDGQTNLSSSSCAHCTLDCTMADSLQDEEAKKWPKENSKEVKSKLQ